MEIIIFSSWFWQAFKQITHKLKMKRFKNPTLTFFLYLEKKREKPATEVFHLALC